MSKWQQNAAISKNRSASKSQDGWIWTAYRRCFIEGENVQLVSEETGYSRASIYTWRRKYQSGGPARLMNSKDDPRGILNKGKPSSTNEIDALKQQMLEMQLEIDILKETINVLKKRPRRLQSSVEEQGEGSDC